VDVAIRARVIAFALLALTGCERPSVNVGSACSLNTECDAPLVCELGRCRRQCVDSRDCAAGLLCLSVGEMGGACQIDDEADCALSSDCGEHLACRFETCTTECADDRDCPPGASCKMDTEAMSLACVEAVPELCIYNSDCPEGLVCNEDQQCVRECLSDRDCEDDRQCDEQGFCVLRADGGA
jgi:hypothetical protein